MKKVYNKLIRDKTPEIIRADNHSASTRVLDKKELLKKLVEESQEVLESENRDDMIKELSDVQEVMMAIYKTFDIECGDVTKRARKRREERGAFESRIFLESTETNN
jgi:predicted house-cleaning noncanonical NTP pyrophosphatase (MazG superfamily)